MHADALHRFPSVLECTCMLCASTELSYHLNRLMHLPSSHNQCCIGVNSCTSLLRTAHCCTALDTLPVTAITANLKMQSVCSAILLPHLSASWRVL
jgi:hypothetical protein